MPRRRSRVKQGARANAPAPTPVCEAVDSSQTASAAPSVSARTCKEVLQLEDWMLHARDNPLLPLFDTAVDRGRR